MTVVPLRIVNVTLPSLTTVLPVLVTVALSVTSWAPVLKVAVASLAVVVVGEAALGLIWPARAGVSLFSGLMVEGVSRSSNPSRDNRTRRGTAARRRAFREFRDW